MHLNFPDLLAFNFLEHDGHSSTFGKQDFSFEVIPKVFKLSSKVSMIVKNLEKPSN